MFVTPQHQRKRQGQGQAEIDASTSRISPRKRLKMSTSIDFDDINVRINNKTALQQLVLDINNKKVLLSPFVRFKFKTSGFYLFLSLCHFNSLKANESIQLAIK